MYKYVGIEDLVASALIELMNQDKKIRRVSFQTLADYGAVIVRLLAESGQDAILFLTRESTYEFIHDYANFFLIANNDGVEYIELIEGVTTESLRIQFRKNLTVDMAKAFAGEESVKILNAKATG